jgi:hypothetical protein
MTIDEMDKDLARFDSFDSLSARVGYWLRRLELSKPGDDATERFNSVVEKHSQRILAVMRAG